MNTFLSQQNTQNTVTLGVGTVPAGAAIITCPGGSPTSCQTTGVPVVTNPVGNLVTTGITIPGSSLTWQDQNTAIYPASVTGLVQCGDGITPPGGVQDPGPCDTFAMDRNFRTPYVENWTLGVQHAFSSKLSLDVSYVGNHGVRLTGVRDLNQPDPATGVRPFSGQYPYIGIINYLSNLYGSTYNGLQATMTSRNYHGLDFIAGYTYSHGLDYMSSNWVAFLPKDSTQPALEHASSDYDIRHRFTLSVTYALPEKKTKSQLLEGWQVNTIISLQTGQPWNVNDQGNDFSGTGEATERWDFFGNPSDFKSGGPNSLPYCSTANPQVPTDLSSVSCGYTTQGTTIGVPLSASQTQAFWNSCLAKAPDVSPNGTLATGGCYVSLNGRSVLTPPAGGTFGTMGRNIFRDTGFHNVDFSVSKTFKFRERLQAQFRVEMFNIFNHPNFANPNGGTSGYGQGAFSDPSAIGQFGCGCATPDNAAFNPVLGSGSARAIQLGLKFTF
jgi:hypothetical protein